MNSEKIKEMQTFFLITGLISGIVAAISAFGYNYYSNLNDHKSEKNAQKERMDIQNEISDGKQQLSKKIENQDSILMEIKKDSNEIKNEIKSSSKEKKQDINVQSSPNTIIQINEQGDNVINNPEIPRPTVRLNDWAVKNQKINEILRRPRRNSIKLPTEHLPYDSLYHNQFLVYYESKLMETKAYFILKRKDVAECDISVNGMIEAYFGTSDLGHVTILHNPQNGVYRMNYYTEEPINDIMTELTFIK